MNVVSLAAAAPRGSASLQGKAAVVTGSTSGIGLGIARAMAAQGANILLNGFGNSAAIERLRREIAADSRVDVDYDGADLSRPDQVRRMIETATAAFGAVDILVNNAGIQHVAPLEDFAPEKWDAILSINLSGAFHAIRAVFAEMKRRKFGRIINVASAHGLVGSPFKAAYVAAKHGIVGLTKVVALEGAEAGVTCNAICPGYVWTPLVEKQIDDQAKAHKISREEVIGDVLLSHQPNKRFAAVDEIGALAAFLAGDTAASITGAALPIDGGWVAQ